MLLLISGVAFFDCIGQSTERHFTQKELPAKCFIYLMNGEIYNGIVYTDNGKQITAALTNGTNARYDYIDILKFHKESSGISASGDSRFHYNKGFFAHFVVALNSFSDNATVVTQLTIGTRLNKRISVGGGYSVDGYEIDFSQIALRQFNILALYGYGRYNITSGRLRTYGFTRIGWGLSLDNFREDYEGGISLSGGVGIILSSKRKLRWLLELGINSQKVTGEFRGRDNNGQDIMVQFDSFLQRPLLKIGLEFQ